jgi:Asp/Glu/Hydantoin racemase
MAITKGFLGIVMLDTQFPRPLGDVGNPDTFAVPTHQEIIRTTGPAMVVETAASFRKARMVPAFQIIVRNLERRGARAITTSCGFLVLIQKELQAVVRVPVITSSLLLLPGLLRKHKQVGVLTISSAKLGHEHLRCAGVPRERLGDVLVQGVEPGTEFVTRILGNQPQLDLVRAQQDVVAAALALKARAPDLTTVVLECTNMPPYQAAIEAATGFKTLWLKDMPRLFDWHKPAVPVATVSAVTSTAPLAGPSATQTATAEMPTTSSA